MASRGSTWLVLSALCAATCGGCATTTPPAPGRAFGRAAGVATVSEPDEAAIPAAASALVFRAPAAGDAEELDLWRDTRAPSAFFGYVEPVTEYYHVTTVDRQVSGGWGYPLGAGFGNNGGGYGYLDRYERCAVTEKIGAVHR